MLPQLNYRARKADIDALVLYPRPTIHLDTYWGNDGWLGTDWSHPVQTMARALALVSTGGRILFKGDVNEVAVGSNLLFDIVIEGVGGLHHPDQPSTAYDYGASMWRKTATDAAALIEVKGRGWQFHNIAFDAPASYAAVKLTRNALATTAEFDASHAVFKNCRFLSGKYGIEDNGGANNVTIEGCEFAGMTTAAIIGTSTSVANPRAWKIFDNIFPSSVSSLGNATHIDAALNESVIARNFFGTVLSTAKYIDLTGGAGNIVTFNTLAGAYELSDYVAGTGDVWYQNACAVDASTAPDGVSLLVPD